MTPCLALLVAVAVVACDDSDDRVSVEWHDVTMSADRTVLTVHHAIPLDARCLRIPDGVTIDIDGDTATLQAWVRRVDAGDGTVCEDDCAQLTQTLVLDTPLPDNIAVQPPSDAAATCGAGGATVPT